MANHGYCKNCWWWNRTGKTTGNCIMHSYFESMCRADENSYCPDYINREKENKKQKHTLEEFCRDTKLPFFKYIELG